ncbi:M28 family peptidase [Phytomonospora sp. NPDC050363]|uniref:M28 family metallopeptidase n=1 Tax=Phytomonospora sp. NPDC050363 TaxID=3155642 RepID=UPI003401D57A
MRAIVDRLAADDFTGRRVGTPGGRAAASWLAELFGELGAEVRFDEFALAGAVREVYATPRLRFDDGENVTDLVFRRDFCEHLATAELGDARDARLAHPDGAVAGAWVLVDGWSPEAAADAAGRGAAGLLIPRGTDAAGWMPKMIAGPPVVDIPVLAVRTGLHARMGRSVGTGRVTATVPVRAVDVTAQNVVAEFRPPGAGVNVLLTAHFDGVGDDPAYRLPAACDNASGVAATIEAARLLHTELPPGVGLSVALLDAEEAGAHGSAHHAPQVAPGTYVVNLDGAAQLSSAAVEAGGAAEALLAALDRAGRGLGVPLRAEAMPSDNRRYAAADLPSIGIGMGMPGYQTPAETSDRVEDATLIAAASLVHATVADLVSTTAPDPD